MTHTHTYKENLNTAPDNWKMTSPALYLHQTLTSFLYARHIEHTHPFPKGDWCKEIGFMKIPCSGVKWGFFEPHNSKRWKLFSCFQWRPLSKNGNKVPSGLQSCVIARWIGIHQGVKNMESLPGIWDRAQRCECPNISNGSAGFWSMISGENSPESRCSKGRLKRQAQPQQDRTFLRGTAYLKASTRGLLEGHVCGGNW